MRGVSGVWVEYGLASDRIRTSETAKAPRSVQDGRLDLVALVLLRHATQQVQRSVVAAGGDVEPRLSLIHI